MDTLKNLGDATRIGSLLKANKTSEASGFFPYDHFDYSDKLQNTDVLPYSHMMLFTVNFSAVMLLKQTSISRLSYEIVEWSKHKQLSNWDIRSHNQFWVRHISTCKKCGIRNKWALSKTPCAGIATKMLFQLWMHWKSLCFLPRQRFRYFDFEASLYLNWFDQYLPAQLYRCKVLFPDRGRPRPIGRNSKSCS